MDKLPETCKDCAEYGSVFCNDCMEELMENVAESDRVVFSQALREIAKKDTVPKDKDGTILSKVLKNE